MKTIVTFDNLSSGSYTLTVTDVALCQKSLSVNLLTPNSFSVIGVLSSQTSSIDNNGVAKGGLQVVEEMI